jgi:hypothetical protein
MAPYLEINVWSLQVQVQEPQKMNLERYLRLRQAVPVLLGKKCSLTAFAQYKHALSS